MSVFVVHDSLAVRMTAWQWSMSVLYDSLAVKHVCVVWQLCSEACLCCKTACQWSMSVWQLGSEACLFLCCMTAGEGDRWLPGCQRSVSVSVLYDSRWRWQKTTWLACLFLYLVVSEACLFLCCMTAGEGDRRLPGWLQPSQHCPDEACPLHGCHQACLSHCPHHPPAPWQRPLVGHGWFWSSITDTPRCSCVSEGHSDYV